MVYRRNAQHVLTQQQMYTHNQPNKQADLLTNKQPRINLPTKKYTERGESLLLHVIFLPHLILHFHSEKRLINQPK